MTPVLATPEQLRLYREDHRIEVDATGWPLVCAHDRIPVLERGKPAKKLWRHDPGAIARLARLERGEPEW